MPKSVASKSNWLRRRVRSRRFSYNLIFAAVLTALLSATFVSKWTRAVQAAGDVSLNTIGTAVTQNFDSLATTGTTNTWTDGTTLTGWYAQFELIAGPTTYIGDPGTSTTGAVHSYGVAGTNPVTERALGSIASGTTGIVYNAVK